jgi:hypothetical protein
MRYVKGASKVGIKIGNAVVEQSDGGTNNLVCKVLTGDVTLSADCADYHVLDANGADRTITLPPVSALEQSATRAKRAITFRNAGAGNNLIIKNGATTVDTLAPGNSCVFKSSNTNWYLVLASRTAMFLLACLLVLGVCGKTQAATAFAQTTTINTNENIPVVIALTGADTNSSALTFTIVTVPGHGTVNCAPNTTYAPGLALNCTYTPSANYYGADSFSFVTYDGLTTSLPASVALNVVFTGQNTFPGMTVSGRTLINSSGAWTGSQGAVYSVATTTGTGSAQVFAHGLGGTPSMCIVGALGSPAGTGIWSITKSVGATSITVTATSGVTYSINALK